MKNLAGPLVALALGNFLFGCESRVPVPAQQSNVIIVLDQHRSDYRALGSGMELQRKALRKERAVALERALPSRRANAWLGTVSATYAADSNTKAGVMVKLSGSDNAYVGTWNNFLSDVGDKTLFAEGTNLYRSTISLKKGQLVRFSGRFLESGQDFLRERSLTDNGSMTMPEFVFVFESIEPL